MATMYELTGEYRELLALAGDPDIDPQALNDTLEAIQGEIEEKADCTAVIINELTEEAEKIKAEETRLYKRRKAFENHAARLKDGLYNAMKTVGREKFKTTLFSFNIQNNPVKLVIDDESKVPKEYLIEQAPKVDNTALKEYLKNGNTCSYAHLEQTEGLRIK